MQPSLPRFFKKSHRQIAQKIAFKPYQINRLHSVGRSVEAFKEHIRGGYIHLIAMDKAVICGG